MNKYFKYFCMSIIIFILGYTILTIGNYILYALAASLPINNFSENIVPNLLGYLTTIIPIIGLLMMIIGSITIIYSILNYIFRNISNSFNINEKGKDQDGFVRKPRDITSGICGWIAGGVVILITRFIPDEYLIIIILLSLLSAYIVLQIIYSFSSHDFTTWKCNNHIKFWIFVSSFVWIGLGVITYYYFKGKERKYIILNKNYL